MTEKQIIAEYKQVRNFKDEYVLDYDEMYFVDQIVRLHAKLANNTDIIDGVVDWLPFMENKKLFKNAWKDNYMLKFDDGTECRYRDEHPFAIMTHFKIT